MYQLSEHRDPACTRLVTERHSHIGRPHPSSDNYPKTMTVVSAVLVTVGSIPHLSAVSAGAAGAVLASDAAKFVGSLAIDLGGWLQNDVVVCEDKKKKTK